MFRKIVISGLIVMLVLTGFFSATFVSAEDTALMPESDFPPLPENVTQPESSLVAPSGTWELVVIDPDEGGINVRNAYSQGEPGVFYFKIDSYASWSSVYDMYGLVWLDTDRNSSTGYPVNDIGADYWIIVGYYYESVYRWTGSSWSYSSGLDYFSYTNNSVEMGVNNAAIGGTNTVDVVFGMIDRSTWYWDHAPDTGHVTVNDIWIGDLFVGSDDISFSSTPVSSSDITVYAEVHNSANAPVRDVEVRFFADRTTHIYHTVVIDYIPAGGSAKIGVPWHVPSQEGPHTVKVVVDPNNLLNETVESNNEATTQVSVLPAPSPAAAEDESAGILGTQGSVMNTALLAIIIVMLFGLMVVFVKQHRRE